MKFIPKFTLLMSLLVLSACATNTNLIKAKRNIASEGGRDIGNGGDVAVCSKSSENIFNGIYPLDEILSDEDVSLKIDDSDKYMNDLIKKLSEISVIGLELQIFYDSYKNKKNNNTYYVWSKNDGPLKDIKDERLGFRTLPSNCYKKQAIIRTQHNDESPMEFIYHKNTIENLKKQNKIHWLLIHEFLWAFSEDAKEVREFNIFFHTKDFFMTSNEVIYNKLKKLNSIKKNYWTKTYGAYWDKYFVYDRIIIEYDHKSLFKRIIDMNKMEITTLGENFITDKIDFIAPLLEAKNEQRGFLVKSNNKCYFYYPNLKDVKMFNNCYFTNVDFAEVYPSVVWIKFKNGLSKIIHPNTGLNYDNLLSSFDEDIEVMTDQRSFAKTFKLSEKLIDHLNNNAIYFAKKQNTYGLVKIDFSSNAKSFPIISFHENISQFNNCSNDLGRKDLCALAFHTTTPQFSSTVISIFKSTFNDHDDSQILDYKFLDLEMMNNYIKYFSEKSIQQGYPSSSQFFVFTSQGKQGVYDIKEGKLILPAKIPYTYKISLSHTPKGIFKITNAENHNGLINTNDNCYIDPAYDIEYILNDYIKVKSNKRKDKDYSENRYKELCTKFDQIGF